MGLLKNLLLDVVACIVCARNNIGQMENPMQPENTTRASKWLSEVALYKIEL